MVLGCEIKFFKSFIEKFGLAAPRIRTFLGLYFFKYINAFNEELNFSYHLNEQTDLGNFFLIYLIYYQQLLFF